METNTEAEVEAADPNDTMTAATTNNDDYSYRDRRGSDWSRDQYNDYWSDARSWGYGGRSKGCGSSTSNPRERGRFVTQMMEDERYH